MFSPAQQQVSKKYLNNTSISTWCPRGLSHLRNARLVLGVFQAAVDEYYKVHGKLDVREFIQAFTATFARQVTDPGAINAFKWANDVVKKINNDYRACVYTEDFQNLSHYARFEAFNYTNYENERVGAIYEKKLVDAINDQAENDNPFLFEHKEDLVEYWAWKIATTSSMKYWEWLDLHKPNHLIYKPGDPDFTL